jgi:hypothetical protein
MIEGDLSSGKVALARCQGTTLLELRQRTAGANSGGTHHEELKVHERGNSILRLYGPVTGTLTVEGTRFLLQGFPTLPS